MAEKKSKTMIDYTALAKELLGEQTFLDALAEAIEKRRWEQEIARRKEIASYHRFDHVDNVCVHCGEKFWMTETQSNLNKKCPKAKTNEAA